MLGVGVQPVSAALAPVLGVDSGVVVTAVDPGGPAADDLAPTDVIVTIDGRAIESIDSWHARVLRLAAGDTVSLGVRSGGENRNVQITAVPAAPTAAEPATHTLGLQLAPVANSGSRVLRVEPGSRGAATSLQPGDVITAVGRQSAPTPSDIARAFAAVSPGGALIIAFTRGQDHHLAAIHKITADSR
jgi:S1-C subfamily serine protease